MSKAKYISVEEAAHAWQISERSARNYCAQGRVEGALLEGKTWKIPAAAKKPERKPFILTPEESALQEEIRTKLRFFDKATAVECGFESINIASTSAQEDFFNGKKITSSMFTQKLWDYPAESQIAVFNENKFLGLIYKDQQGRPGYKFVLN